MNILELPFDQYQRYKIAQEAMEALRKPGQKFKILDAGGHPGLINEFLPRDDTFVVDKLDCDIPNFQKGDILDLPFKDSSFDVVTSVDVLEHIPPERRERFLGELWRVSKDYVLVAAPFDNPEVAQADRILFEFIKVKLGYIHHFLDEHINYKLPNKDATINSLRRMGADIFSVPNGNLSRWLPLMIVVYYMDIDPKFKKLAKTINSFYNENVYKVDNCEPCYRYAIVASKKMLRTSTVRKLQGLIYSNNKNSHVDFSPVLGLMGLFNLDMIKEKDQELREIGLNLGNLIQHSQNLENIIREKEAHIQNLIEQAEDRERIIERKEMDLSGLAEEKGILERALADREGHISNLTEHAANLQKVIEGKEGELRGLIEEKGNLEKLLAEKDGHINNLTEHAGNLQKVIEGKEGEVRGLTEAKGNLEKMLGEKEGQISNLTVHVGNLERLIEGKQGEIAGLIEEKGNLEKQLADKDGHINNLTEHAGNLKKLIEGKEGEIRGLVEEKGHLERVIADREGQIGNLAEQLNHLDHSVRERDIQISLLRDFEGKVKSTLPYKLYRYLRIYKIVNS